MTSWAHIPYSTRKRISAAVFARDSYRCRIQGPRCTGRAEQVDHIVPIAKGGHPLDLTNMRAACGPCNQAGGAAITNARRRRVRRRW